VIASAGTLSEDRACSSIRSPSAADYRVCRDFRK